MSESDDDKLSTPSIDSDSISTSGNRDSINSDIRDILSKLDLNGIAEFSDESGISTGSSGASSPSISSSKEYTTNEVDLGSQERDHTELEIVQNLDTQDTEGQTTPKGNKCAEITRGKQSSGDKKKKHSSLGGFFKRLSFSKESTPANEPAKVSKPAKGTIVNLRVESLPQVFITKYLGSRPCTGIWGTEHTRGPVDDMISTVRTVLCNGQDLPLVKLSISEKGIDVSEHKQNKGGSIETGTIPIEFISYGVQDVRFMRVFTFIIVREMSWKAKKMECHAYICDSPLTSKKLSLSVALAFKVYASTLEGKSLKFGIDLTSQQEVIANKVKRTEDDECDA